MSGREHSWFTWLFLNPIYNHTALASSLKTSTSCIDKSIAPSSWTCHSQFTLQHATRCHQKHSQFTSSFFSSSVLYVAAYTWKLPYFDFLSGSAGTKLTVNNTKLVFHDTAFAGCLSCFQPKLEK